MIENRLQIEHIVKNMATGIRYIKENEKQMVERLAIHLNDPDHTLNEKIDDIIRIAEDLKVHKKSYKEMDERLMLITDIMNVMTKEKQNDKETV